MNSMSKRMRELEEQLAAAQVREVRIRESFENYIRSMNMVEAKQALALPTDTSALEAIVAKAGEVMRERCADACEYRGGFELAKTWDGCVKAIRALPGVTLEDLK